MNGTACSIFLRNWKFMLKGKVQNTWPFDSPETREITLVRQGVLDHLVKDLRQQWDLQTALDVGCGVGYFSKTLADLNFRARAIDGRAENAAKAQRRYPEISFRTQNAEELQAANLGTFDFALCAGLLYHLENPFRAIRGLRAVTGKILLIESMCAPGPEPCLQLLDEYSSDDQGLNYVAFYPTESCLTKMHYRAEFPFVYGFANPPDYRAFRRTADRKKERILLVAATKFLNSPGLALLQVPCREWELWRIPVSAGRRLSRLAAMGRELLSSS